jgi:hypothetical protein
MSIRAVVIGVTSVGDARTVGIGRSICLDETAAVILSAGRALWAVRLQAAESLGTNTNAVADPDVLDIPAYSDSFADDLVADATGYTMTCQYR